MTRRAQSLDAAVRVLRRTCPEPAWTHVMSGVCPVLHNGPWAITVLTVPPSSIHFTAPDVRVDLKALDVDRLPALLAALGAPDLAEETTR